MTDPTLKLICLNVFFKFNKTIMGNMQMKTFIHSQAFVYVHKKVSIIDTRHSEIRPRTELQLNTNKDLNTYWYNLEVICLNTRAGMISFSNRN